MLHEINDKVTDVELEIKKILSLSDGKRKVEILIDGGVFSRMLNTDKNTLKMLNKALNSAAALIIYRASPKQK